jgi:hypothetical protein
LAEFDEGFESDDRLGRVADGGAGGGIKHPRRQGIRGAVRQGDHNAVAGGVGATANDPDFVAEKRWWRYSTRAVSAR